MIRPGIVPLALAAALALGVTADTGAQQANPCAAKNPCAAAPAVDPKLITRPAGTRPFSGKRAALVRLGAELWKDTRLSTNGLSCQTCHQGNSNFNATFAKPFPHTVAMAEAKAGLKRIHLDEMVQICLVVPMAAKPLPWGSKELAALTAYTGEVQKGFRAAARKGSGAPANPCAPKNPCAPRR